MAKKDDELAIDFSKVFSFFKKEQKKPARHKKIEISEEPGASEKIQAEDATPGSAEKCDELSLDIKGIWNFINKNRIILLILIPIILSIFFRAQTYYLPQTDGWAENSVQSYYKSQITAQVDQQYPNLPVENKKKIVDEEAQNYINSHRSEYDQQVKAVSENFKSHFQDETGQTYLLEIDTYQWFRYGRDFIRHGYIGDKIIEGRAYDMHMLAPFGKPVEKSVLNPYLGVLLYKILSPITGTSLMGAFFMLPIILMTLAVIPAFFVGRKIGGDIAGFFTAVLIAVHPAVLTRTIGGFSDTDSYVVIFPLLVSWLFMEAFDTDKTIKKAAYSSIAGLCIGLFAFAWYGWWYIFDFVIATILIYIFYYILTEYFINKKRLFTDITKDSKIRGMLIVFLLFFVFSAIFVIAFINFNSFKGAAFEQPLSVIRLKEAAKITLWPNVFTTVAEMNAASLSSIAEAMGGKFLFLIGLAGIFLILLKNIREEKSGERKIAYFILFALWFFAAVYACTKGIRFTVILTPAYAIGMGVAVSFVYYNASRWVSKEMGIGIPLVKVFLVILLCLLLIPPLKAANMTSKAEMPLVNDAWNSALTKIKMNSKEDAIINSWWDFGHWFKALGDRAVTFDGASQNRPQAHWIGKVLLTSDEDQAIGILRMLDCGANTAFDLLLNETNNTHDSIDTIYKIIVMNNEDAKKELIKHVSEKKADEVLKYTHCTPPEDFFITSEDMVGKGGVWAHFGSWNFEKAKIWNDYRGMDMSSAVKSMMNEFNYTKENAEKLYYDVQAISNENEANTWISPWPSYIGTSSCIKNSNSTARCDFSIQNQVWPFNVNLTDFDASIDTQKGVIYPYSIVYVENNEFREKKFANNTLPYSIAFISDEAGMRAVMMDPALAKSMFTRLFYFNGTGLKHFDFFDKERDLTGLEIYTWKVDWEGKNASQKSNIQISS